MTLLSTKDILYFVGAICLIWITVFLCWALYQAGRLIKQSNEIVDDARQKLAEVERIVSGVGRTIGSVVEGGKHIASMFGGSSEDHKKKKHENSRN